jgi:periplasmic protein TonB
MPLKRENPTGRLASMGVVIVMHIGIIWGLAYGLNRTNVEVIPPPLTADVLEEELEEEEPPPPDYVPPPEISIDLPAATSATAITAVTDKKAPPPPPPAPKQKVTTLPKSIKHTQPDYPSASRRLNEEGSVVVDILVGEDGNIKEAKVATSSGFPRLDEAAVKEALRRWKYKPGTEDGKPVAMWHKVKVTFKLTT